MASDLLAMASKLQLNPVGVSFHVGSQQRNPGQWDAPLAQVAWLFDELAQHDLPLSLINLGGGFPAIYRSSVPPIAAYGDAISRSFERHFYSRGRTPRIIAEPGRYLVADAGVIATEVVLVARKAYTEDLRWVFVDIGRYGGLAETEGEAISYMISTPHDGGPDRAGRDRRPDLRLGRRHVRADALPPAPGPGGGRHPPPAVGRRVHEHLRQCGLQRLPPAAGRLPLAVVPWPAAADRQSRRSAPPDKMPG